MRKSLTIVLIISFALVAGGLTPTLGEENVTLNITAYFNKGGDDLRAAIKKTIKAYSGPINIAMFSFSDYELKNFLANHVQNRSVKILLSTESLSKEESMICHALNFLDNIEIRYRSDIHHKFVVIGKEAVITGSANWSENSFDIDYNNLIVIENRKIAEAFENEFNRLWESDKGSPGCYEKE